MAPTFERQSLPFPAPAAHRARFDALPAVPIAVDATPAERDSLNVMREWGQSIEFGDPYLRGHCSRVAEHAVDLAAALRVDSRTRMTIAAGAYLHGVGRMRVPLALQNKPAAFTPQERAAIQQIPLWGTEILAKVRIPWDVIPIVLWHNERTDGSGYPDALRGEQIPLAAQIVGIANVFDAMISPRAHRPALKPAQAVRTLARSTDCWSPELFRTYLRQLQARYPGSLRLA